jgi:hypothetical protein
MKRAIFKFHGEIYGSYARSRDAGCGSEIANRATDKEAHEKAVAGIEVADQSRSPGNDEDPVIEQEQFQGEPHAGDTRHSGPSWDASKGHDKIVKMLLDNREMYRRLC